MKQIGDLSKQCVCLVLDMNACNECSFCGLMDIGKGFSKEGYYEVCSKPNLDIGKHSLHLLRVTSCLSKKWIWKLKIFCTIWNGDSL